MNVSTPGRICLFGEHQDYLGLPVIAAAISLRIRISGEHRTGSAAIVHMPDIGAEDSIPLDSDLQYRHHRDYLRSAVQVLRQNGYTFSRGIEAEVRGEIPINSGTSSSSALVVSWIHLLTRLSDQAQAPDPATIAALAHRAEVLEFNEPGGTMDHYSTSLGGVIFLDTAGEQTAEALTPRLGSFVLADSGEHKNTKDILARVKGGVLRIASKLHEEDPTASLLALDAGEIDRFSSLLSEDEVMLLEATLGNRDITIEGLELLREERIDHVRLGKLLHRHQSHLREPLRISTPKIDEMIQTAYDAGALGAKINGSGGGGCMFAYAPEDPHAVLDALRPYGRAWIVDVDEGSREDREAHGVRSSEERKDGES